MISKCLLMSPWTRIPFGCISKCRRARPAQCQLTHQLSRADVWIWCCQQGVKTPVAPTIVFLNLWKLLFISKLTIFTYENQTKEYKWYVNNSPELFFAKAHLPSTYHVEMLSLVWSWSSITALVRKTLEPVACLLIASLQVLRLTLLVTIKSHRCWALPTARPCAMSFHAFPRNPRSPWKDR